MSICKQHKERQKKKKSYRVFAETGKLTFYTEYLQAKQDRKKLFILKKMHSIFAMIAHRTNKTLKCHLACLSVIFVRPRLHQWAEFFLYPGDMLLLCIYLQTCLRYVTEGAELSLSCQHVYIQSRIKALAMYGCSNSLDVQTFLT